MYHISTNKTEESWSRSDIRKAAPGTDSNEILERINMATAQTMPYSTAVDFLKLQLATWRRFYKEDDTVQVDEAYTAENKQVSQIRSLNIVYYVRVIDSETIKVTGGLFDTIKDSCKKLFEDVNIPIIDAPKGDEDAKKAEEEEQPEEKENPPAHEKPAEEDVEALEGVD